MVSCRICGAWFASTDVPIPHIQRCLERMWPGTMLKAIYRYGQDTEREGFEEFARALDRTSAFMRGFRAAVPA